MKKQIKKLFKKAESFLFVIKDKSNEIGTWLNDFLRKIDWCTSHRERYHISEPKTEEKGPRKYSTTENGITTKYI